MSERELEGFETGFDEDQLHAAVDKLIAAVFSVLRGHDPFVKWVALMEATAHWHAIDSLDNKFTGKQITAEMERFSAEVRKRVPAHRRRLLRNV
jgi:hypothetical protein